MPLKVPGPRRLNKAFVLVLLAASIVILSAAPAWSVGRFTTVVIDPGHGGFDRGGIPGQRVAEKTVALDVALRLQRDLERQGYHTVMTRNQDVFVPLPERVAIANSYRNAIFVCIHFNAAGRSGANGIETYFYSRESAQLAASIHRSVCAGAPTENRGLRRRGYYVLRKTRIPAVLVECGFLTNPLEAELAQTAGYRQKLANEIASGIRGQPQMADRRTGSARFSYASDLDEPGLYRVDASGRSAVAAADGRAVHHSKKKKTVSKKSAHSSKKKKSSKTTAKKKSAKTKKKKKPADQPNE
jgi:N-acetylmuramoyl-L-alanine amidase